VNEPTTAAGTCACGCGGRPRLRTSRYLPGHHKQRPDPLAGRYRVDAATGCWVFQGYKLWNGYGQVTYRCRRWLAHRLSYFLRHGELPEGDLQLHHACANRACVNPDHLVPVTGVENRRAAPTKLDPCKIARIFAMHDEGSSQGEIAAVIGVDRTSVGKVLRGAMWREAARAA
jgi:hypothetical protein